MTGDSRQFVVRRPRHEAASDDACQIWLETEKPDAPLASEVSLVDLSRQGAQLRLPNPLESGRQVHVRIRHLESELDLSLTATVRWQRNRGPDNWAVGCIFDEELSYELMGELFLSGVLNMDPVES